MNAWRFTASFKFGLGLALLAGCGGGGGGGDTQAPAATLDAPANFSNGLTGTLTLSATASDNVGVTSVEFQIDGQAISSTASGPPYLASVNSANHAPGQHVLRTRARDVAGNISAWSSATVNFGGTAVTPSGFTKLDAWVGSIAAGTAFAQASDGRFFVAEQGGNLRIVASNGTLLTTPFLSLTVNSLDERGLLGVALHPDFAINGFAYVHYTTGTAPIHNRVSRFQAIPPSSNVVSANSEFPILDLPTLGATNHNGGAIHFGVDGKLYVAVGENAILANSQDLNSPLGKLLRINDNGSIPTDNPFFSPAKSAHANAVWAYGLRNPFTFAVQPLTGRIHVNDVGAGTWEEINRGVPGANFGWPVSEGPDGLLPSHAAPLFAYKHSAANPPGSGPGGFFVGNVIAGGTFYPASGPFPAAYRGNYFFADFGARFVGLIDLANGNAAYRFASLADDPVDMLVGADGALYVLTRGAIARISAN